MLVGLILKNLKSDLRFLHAYLRYKNVFLTYRYSPKCDPGGVVRVHILRFSEILPEEWVPGGIIILARETKIAEMKLSEPFKNNFQSSENSVEKFGILFLSVLIKVFCFSEKCLRN